MHKTYPLCGIVEFMASLMIKEHENGVIEMSYACTDKSRSAFYCLLESREWKRDHGCGMTETVLRCLASKIKEYHLLQRQSNIESGIDCEFDMKQMEKIFDAVTGTDQIGREDLKTAIKNKIREIAAV